MEEERISNLIKSFEGSKELIDQLVPLMENYCLYNQQIEAAIDAIKNNEIEEKSKKLNDLLGKIDSNQEKIKNTQDEILKKYEQLCEKKEKLDEREKRLESLEETLKGFEEKINKIELKIDKDHDSYKEIISNIEMKIKDYIDDMINDMF